VRSREVEFDATVEIDGAEVEVTVRVEVEPSVAPTIRLDPDDCDPGDGGSFNVLSVTRNDTGKDVTAEVDHNQFRDDGCQQAADDDEADYDTAMEAQADAARDLKVVVASLAVRDHSTSRMK